MDAIFTLQSIQEVTAMFWKRYNQQKVWAFYAPMGSGKTTFIHTLCTHVLQVKNNIGSPTFSIINEYDSPVVGTVYHTDWYRLKDEEEAINIGIEDMLASGNLCLIEWAEKAPNLLPENTLHIYLEILDADTRRIFVESNKENILS
ncbi:MAG: tRNA (adenosine(37)-N6)-threonylcarbamoyltransferase complex ATPase subunit type 1 TsaE [Chitinophagaceae bacterium]|nr:tRNA (adenosine(37)-N6)-threonylcarbamoyltransferase complex ATPase subunit type 1 TsaE [Chitinophagaceae bacterium]MCZ2298407.1 tRNA (adenosine(37)-N6)-threonylcarbamoyltransferase complex ATPase subunit type 1 TsaE [Chitinophagales bacterium]